MPSSRILAPSLTSAYSSRSTISAVDPALPIASTQTLEAIVESEFGRPRFVSTLLGTFAGMALMLMTVTGLDPIEDRWLTVKVALLVAYVVLGYYALRAQSLQRRWACLAGAVATFGFIYSVARAHDPLGFLA